MNNKEFERIIADSMPIPTLITWDFNLQMNVVICKVAALPGDKTPYVLITFSQKELEKLDDLLIEAKVGAAKARFIMLLSGAALKQQNGEIDKLIRNEIPEATDTLWDDLSEDDACVNIYGMDYNEKIKTVSMTFKKRDSINSLLPKIENARKALLQKIAA
jgi:hypothetical protein